MAGRKRLFWREAHKIGNGRKDVKAEHTWGGNGILGTAHKVHVSLKKGENKVG